MPIDLPPTEGDRTGPCHIVWNHRREFYKGGESLLAAATALAGVLVVAAAAVGVNKAPGWARWNYTGYEGKDAWPEYRALLEQDIELNKRGVAPRVARGGGQATAYVPDPSETDD